MWNNGKVSNKRKRDPVIRDHATEDEDEEEGREMERELKDYSTTDGEDEEEERKLKREAPLLRQKSPRKTLPLQLRPFK